MKKIKICILTLIFSHSIFAQNQEVVYENIFLVPEKTKEALLVEGVKEHNKQYHSQGNTIASLYNVLIGPHSGQYVWLNGPMILSDYDNFPDENHLADWQKNVRNYISKEDVKMAKLNWEASYTPPSWGSPKFLMWRTFKIKQDLESYDKVLEAITKIGEVLKEINAPNPRRVYESIFRSENREDITLVYPFKSFSRFSNGNGLPEGFQSSYDKVNGLGSFKREIGNVLSKHTNGWFDEVLTLVE